MKGILRLFTVSFGSARLFCDIVPLLAISPLVASLILSAAARCHGGGPQFAIEQQSDRLVITCGDDPVATYVFSDKVIPRPYFAHVHAPGAQQVTRNHPPIEGQDSTDHADLHPGIWLAFGDLSGGDFWRNKDRIVHDAFVKAPTTEGNRASFAVRNRYERSGGTTVCQEICKLTFTNTPFGYMLVWDSLFSGTREFYFGDQEEMGLGIRVSTPLSVQRGGMMLDSEGRKNENEIWGKTADWCDYSGRVAGKTIGINVMCHPNNFRPCWMHSRDYGFLAANPFGRSAFGNGEKSKVVVEPGETLRLRYGLLLHSSAMDQGELAAVYSKYARSSTLP